MAIEIIDYDPAWPARFQDELKQLQSALPGTALRVEHIGSTSVPGMPAKPVIDIQISVEAGTPESDYRALIVALGYTHTTVPFSYFHKPATWPHTHHVHVREAGTHEEQRTLAFRDWLRVHPSDQADYAALKRALAAGADAETAAGRFRYSEGKTEFVRRIEKTAKQGSDER